MEIMEITKEFEDLLREAFEAGQDQMNDEWTRNYSTAMYPAVENADLTFEDWLKEKNIKIK